MPCITALDPDANLLEEDQRRLVRFLVQSGRGADVIFAMGTNGEWNRLDAATRQRLIRVVIEEVHKQNPRLEQAGHRPVEVWAGVTAPTRTETLDTIDFVLNAGAHAAVIAPLAIEGVQDPVRFLRREVGDLLDARDRRMPFFLYDNADIASGGRRFLRTRWVKDCSRLDFVRGIKVTAPARRLGHYSKAARQFRDLGPFAIYFGNAPLILEMMKPPHGGLRQLRDRWNRFLRHDMLPAGVVAGPANLFPREWQRAWQVAVAGDEERMDEMARLFGAFRAACSFSGGRRTLAALKRGLRRIEVLSSDALAPGTPALSAAEAERFDAGFEQLRGEIDAALPARWCSDPAEAAGS